MPLFDAVLAVLILVNVVAAGIGVECARKLAARVALVRTTWTVLRETSPVLTSALVDFAAIWDRLMSSRASFESRFSVFCDQLGDFLEDLLQKFMDWFEKTFQPHPADQARKLRALPLRRISVWDLQHGVGPLQQTTCAICLDDWKHAEQIRHHLLNWSCTGRLHDEAMDTLLLQKPWALVCRSEYTPGFEDRIRRTIPQTLYRNPYNPDMLVSWHTTRMVMALSIQRMLNGEPANTSQLGSWDVWSNSPPDGPGWMSWVNEHEVVLPSRRSALAVTQGPWNPRSSVQPRELGLRGRTAGLQFLSSKESTRVLDTTSQGRRVVGSVSGELFGVWDLRSNSQASSTAVMEWRGSDQPVGLAVADGSNDLDWTKLMSVGRRGIIEIWDLRGGSGNTASLGATMNLGPVISKYSIGYGLGTVPGFAEQTGLCPFKLNLESIQFDPWKPTRVAFQHRQMAGVYDMVSASITHLYAPPDRPYYYGDEGPPPKRRMAGTWLPDGRYIVPAQCGDGEVLDFRAAPGAGCAIDYAARGIAGVDTGNDVFRPVNPTAPFFGHTYESDRQEVLSALVLPDLDLVAVGTFEPSVLLTKKGSPE